MSRHQPVNYVVKQDTRPGTRDVSGHRQPRPRRLGHSTYTPVLIDASFPELDIPIPVGAAEPSASASHPR